MERSNGSRQSEHALGISVTQFFKAVGAEDLWQTIEKSAAARVWAVGVIDGEEKAVDADHVKSAAQRRQGEVAAGGAVNVGMEVIGNGLPELRRGARENAAGAGKRVGQTFSHVADD